MGVGQSHELLGKVSDDCVFVCTNREELLDLLAKMQRAVAASLSDTLVSTQPDETKDEGDERGEQEDKCNQTQVPRSDAEEAEDVMQETVPLEVIHVPNHYLGDDGLIGSHPVVLQVLAASISLRSLDLGYNALTARSVEALAGAGSADTSSGCGALPPNLMSLNLAGNHVGREGCELLGEFLASDPPLRELSLFHNGLYDSDVEPLLQGIMANTHLRLLNLDCNYLTGKFLRMLLLLLEHNTTLAVVLFDGPYNPETFERMRKAPPEGRTPHQDDVSGNARALLRQKLLRVDLGGRPPFPADLVREVEAILAVRRAAYLTQLQEEHDVDADTAGWTNDAACSARSTADGASDIGDLADTGEQEHLNEEEEEEEEEEDEEGGGCIHMRSDSSLLPTSTTPNHQYTHTLPFSSAKYGRSYPRPLAKTKYRATNDTAEHGARRSHLGRSGGCGRELSNGFQRLELAPPAQMPCAKTVWRTITDAPCYLRACWCDPRDVPAPYGGVLHYHCRHEPTDNELGDVAADGTLLDSSKNRTEQHRLRMLRCVMQESTLKGHPEKGKKTQYQGCKATGHRCESVGCFGRPRPDKSSMFFFASPHQMQAKTLKMYEQSS